MNEGEALGIDRDGWVQWLRTGFGISDVRIRFAPDVHGRWVAREICIADEDGLRAGALREVPLARLEEWANREDVVALLAGKSKANVGAPRTGPRVPVPARKGRGAYPDSFYRRVAEVVAAGHPATAIADASGVPPTTVNRWIKGARARGLLAPARRRES